MSRIKELRNLPENNINIVDLLSMVIPDKKTKYVDLLIRMMKSTKDIDIHAHEVKAYLRKNYSISNEDIEKIPSFQLPFINIFLDSMFISSDLNEFQKFCEYNERGLILQNDLTTYKSFDEILTQVSLADLKNETKQMENQIRRIFENDEWLIMRPLTFESSLKYGSNTKWCTTMKNEFSYFRKYASNILIYVINKVNGLKVACHKELYDYGELTFWNQKDQRIDSLVSDLPFNILMVIKEEIETNPFGNISYLSVEEYKKEEDKYLRVGFVFEDF